MHSCHWPCHWLVLNYAVGYWCRHRSKGCSKAPPLPCESRRKSRLGCVLQWKTSSTVAGVQRTLERPVLYYTLYKFRNRRIHWALCIHNTPGFRQIKIGPSQTFPTLQRGSYGSVLKEKMPEKSVCWRSCLRPSSITQVPDHKKIQVSLKRGLYIVRRSINLITRNAYSYASTPVTIIPTLTWCPQCEP